MLLYQFDAAVSRGFYMERFQKGKRVQGSGFRVQGCGGSFAAIYMGRCPKVYGAMPEGKWIAGFPFGISNH